MGMQVGASRGYSAPISMPVSAPPPPPKQASSSASDAAAAEQLMASTAGHRGKSVDFNA
jgi:hypothetical protein